ncbi:hypothetical protein NPIL_359791 [Nephila pilipes]|uniref:Uncharacterized protein n=1 Tax=Nephila pilipes TaxID=299642 RepID=A0A8X6Q7U9_NEPPI|nr:hypothetical protein NPIL_359791 [Nephila pilipes]
MPCLIHGRCQWCEGNKRRYTVEILYLSIDLAIQSAFYSGTQPFHLGEFRTESALFLFLEEKYHSKEIRRGKLRRFALPWAQFPRPPNVHHRDPHGERGPGEPPVPPPLLGQLRRFAAPLFGPGEQQLRG